VQAPLLQELVSAAAAAAALLLELCMVAGVAVDYAM
jgi:hypothetical protein